MKYDVVIPVSYKDVAILKKNIRYIRHNLIGTETIYVLLIEYDFAATHPPFVEIVAELVFPSIVYTVPFE